MKLPAYPRAKPSGVEWLGDVPETWEVKRTKWSVLGCINGVWGDEPNGVDDVTCVRVADFDRDNLLVAAEPPTSRTFEPSQLKTRQLRKGDLLIEKSGGGEKQLVGCVVSFTHDFKAVCSNFVARMPVVSELSPRFWCYVHAALYAGKLNYPAIKQTTGIQNLDSSAYLDTPAPFPPPAEQLAIAAFLDRETGRVDRLVAKKRELIERLKEKRIALISRTVTRGLPPAAARAAGLSANAPLKPSALEWLGDIPAQWAVKQLKHLGSIVSGCAFDSSDFTSSGVRVLKIANIQTLRLDWSDESFLPEEFYGEYPAFVVRDGDVVFALTRPIISTGLKAAIAAIGDERILLNQRNALFRPRPEVNRHFFYHALFCVSFKAAFETQIDFTGQQPNISPIDIGNIKIPVPPLPEQAAIAAYLDEETAKLDTLVGKVEEAVERLQEYRTALITAAVTGKIDVRKAGQNELRPALV